MEAGIGVTAVVDRDVAVRDRAAARTTDQRAGKPRDCWRGIAVVGCRAARWRWHIRQTLHVAAGGAGDDWCGVIIEIDRALTGATALSDDITEECNSECQRKRSGALGSGSDRNALPVGRPDNRCIAGNLPIVHIHADRSAILDAYLARAVWRIASDCAIRPVIDNQLPLARRRRPGRIGDNDCVNAGIDLLNIGKGDSRGIWTLRRHRGASRAGPGIRKRCGTANHNVCGE